MADANDGEERQLRLGDLKKTRGLPTRSARARRRTEHIVSPEGGDAEVEVVLELGGALGHEVGDVGGVDVAKVLLVVGEEGRDVSVHEGLAGGLGPRLDGVGRVLHLLALSPAHPGVDQRLLRRLRIRVGLRQGFRRAEARDVLPAQLLLQLALEIADGPRQELQRSGKRPIRRPLRRRHGRDRPRVSPETPSRHLEPHRRAPDRRRARCSYSQRARHTSLTSFKPRLPSVTGHFKQRGRLQPGPAEFCLEGRAGRCADLAANAREPSSAARLRVESARPPSTSFAGRGALFVWGRARRSNRRRRWASSARWGLSSGATDPRRRTAPTGSPTLSG